MDHIEVSLSLGDVVEVLELCGLAQHGMADLGYPSDEVLDIDGLRERITAAIKAAVGE